MASDQTEMMGVTESGNLFDNNRSGSANGAVTESFSQFSEQSHQTSTRTKTKSRSKEKITMDNDQIQTQN